MLKQVGVEAVRWVATLWVYGVRRGRRYLPHDLQRWHVRTLRRMLEWAMANNRRDH